jgi:hypothetical protein
MRGLVNGAGLNAGVTGLSDLFRSSVFSSFVALLSSDEAARGLAGAFVFASAATSDAVDRITGRAARSLIDIVSGTGFSEMGAAVVVGAFCFAGARAAGGTAICWPILGNAELAVTESAAVDV